MGLWLAIFWGCGGCASEPPARSVHYLQADALYHAVLADDPELAQELARGMEGEGLEGSPDTLVHHLDRVHGGLGFLMVAEDRLEAGEAIVGMAAGCGGCHAAQGVALREGAGAWERLWRGDLAGAAELAGVCADREGLEVGPDTGEGEGPSLLALEAVVGAGVDCRAQ